MLSPTRFHPTTFHPLPLAVGRLLRGAALALAWSISAPVFAVSPEQFGAAFAQFEQSRAGHDGATRQSAQAFAALLQAEPGNPVLMAYTGAATSLRANTTWLPWKKMTYAEDGLALLDKALALLPSATAPFAGHLVPAALEVRFVAAATFLAVPGFMNRGDRGNRLLAEVLASPLLQTAPLAFRGDVWLVAAEQAAKAGQRDEARRLLHQAITSGTPQAAVARTRLNGLTS